MRFSALAAAASGTGYSREFPPFRQSATIYIFIDTQPIKRYIYINGNQSVNSELLQQLTETHRHAPTVSRFVEEHFTDLVPHSDYFAHLVRDDVGGEMLPPLPEEVIRRLPRAAATSTPSA